MLYCRQYNPVTIRDAVYPSISGDVVDTMVGVPHIYAGLPTIHVRLPQIPLKSPRKPLLPRSQQRRRRLTSSVSAAQIIGGHVVDAYRALHNANSAKARAKCMQTLYF